MKGEKDPENRRSFPWNEAEWDQDLRAFVKQLISARKQHPALRRGDLDRLHLDVEESWYAFSRSLGDDRVVVALNLSDEPRQVAVPVHELDWGEGAVVEDLITRSRYNVAEQRLTLTLEPWSGCMVGSLPTP